MAVNGSCGDQEVDKSFSRVFSRREKYNTWKQQAAGEASFRVLYYGGATGSVPFLWESQPGTPKHTFNNSPIPPLTPPPSYHQFGSPRANPSLHKKQCSLRNSKIFNSIFAKTSSTKINASFSPSSSSSFSSAYSLPSTPLNSREDDFKELSKPSVVRFGLEDDEYETSGNFSPTSTLCFGPRDGGSSSRRFKFYSLYPFKSVKKVVLSIAGHSKSS